MNLNLSIMKRVHNPLSHPGNLKGILLLPVMIICYYTTHAQTAKPMAKPTAQLAKASPPPKAVAATTTPSTSTTQPPAATKTPVMDELVHTSTTKVLTLHDPEFKKTTIYAKRKQKYEKAFDDTASKTVVYPDGSKIHLKMVKNPSFGGLPTSIKSNTAKGSEKKETKTEKGTQWDCASSSVALTASSTSFLDADYATQAGYIYPGAVYTFENFFNGSYAEQTGIRYPITLVNENPNISGSSYINVKNPGMGTITNAVNKLINEMKGSAANEEFKYQIYETGNSAAQSLQVSGGGSFAGFSASNNYSTSSSSNTVSLTIDATKILYTINMSPQDSGFFADAKIENTRNLMVIGRVSYGIRVLANLTYTFNSSKEADQFKASYSGFGGSANVSLNQVSQSSSVSNTINCYVIGGPGNTTISFNKKDLESQLKAVFRGASYRNAKPIEYSFFNMAGDLVGSYSATDNFTERNCVPNTNAAKLESVFVTFNTGQDGKDNDTHYNIALYGGKTHTNNNYNGYDNNPPDTKDNGEAFLAEYKTGPINVVFNPGTSATNQMTFNPFLVDYKLQDKLTMDYFVNNGGVVHLHIWPNGNDTWNVSGLNLQLNFAGGVSQTVKFGAFTVSQSSTEMTLYFDGTFKAK
jgi:hypothetical protein